MDVREEILTRPVRPIMTGHLLKAGWTPQPLYQSFAGLFVIAALATLAMGCDAT